MLLAIHILIYTRIECTTAKQTLTNDPKDSAYCRTEEEERHSKTGQSCLQLAGCVGILPNDHTFWRNLGDIVGTAHHHANTEHQHHIGDPKYRVK